MKNKKCNERDAVSVEVKGNIRSQPGNVNQKIAEELQYAGKGEVPDKVVRCVYATTSDNATVLPGAPGASESCAVTGYFLAACGTEYCSIHEPSVNLQRILRHDFISPRE